jgi:hypothetical protein
MVLGALTVKAQSIERSVIGSTGNTSSGGGLTLTATIGEAAVDTYSTGSFTLTQGYQQADNSSSSVDEITVDVNYKLYPNPTDGQANLELETLNSSLEGSVFVYSVDGRLVYSKVINIFEKGNVTLNLENEEAGIYFIKIMNVESEVLETIKLIKE